MPSAGASDAAAGRSPRRLRVVQLITRLIVGGAQETALRTAALLAEDPWFETELWTGPETGREGSLHEEAARQGVRVQVIPELRRAVAPGFDLRAARGLRDRMREARLDVLHTHSSKAGILGRWAGRSAGVPAIVHTVHGWSFSGMAPTWERRLFSVLERRAAGWCDVLVAVAAADREEGLARGIGHPAQYRLIRSGIPLESFRDADRHRDRTRSALGIGPDAPVAGSVLRLSEQKAPLDLVRAFGAIARAIPEARFLVVGDGPLRAAAEREARVQGVEERVLWLGLRRDVPEQLSAMDVFLLPSLWEGLPRTLVQAMAAGVPVVCSDIPGNREAVGEEGAGVLVPPRDPEAMATAAVHLLRQRHPETNAAAWEELVRRGRRRADLFDERSMAAELAGLYEELAGRRSLGRVVPKGPKGQGP